VAIVPSTELGLVLQRRLSQSQSVEEPKEEDKKESEQKKTQSDQDRTSKLFAPLAEIMVGGLGARLVAEVDLKNFQNQLLQIIALVLQKKDSLLLDDRLIIDQALGIWISCIVSEPSLLQELFNSASKSFTKIFIEDGLLCGNLAVRSLFRNSIRTICETLSSQSLKEKPVVYFLRVMLGHVSVTDGKAKESKQFFQLLSQLL
jgi:hypothetical protein